MCLVPRQCPSQSVESIRQRCVALTGRAVVGGGSIGATAGRSAQGIRSINAPHGVATRSGILLDGVALTATTDVVDGCFGGIVHQSLVTSEFFIEAEDSSWALAAEVACAAATRGESDCCWWWRKLCPRCWTSSCGTAGQIGWSVASAVSCSANAGVKVSRLVLADGRVWLCDVEWHASLL